MDEIERMLEYLHLLNNPNADTYRCLASLHTIPARTLVISG